MPKLLEEAYVSLRWKILFGEIPAGQPVTAKWVAQAHSIGEKKARLVLNALAADGYLYKAASSFSVAVLCHDQLEEWLQVVQSFSEIGAGRLVLEGGPRVDEIRRHVDQSLRQFPVDEERFYVAALLFFTLLLGGGTSPLSKLVGQLVPPVFFRLLWLADSQAESSRLLPAIDSLLEVVPSRSVRDAKAACGIYFDGVAPALHAQLDVRNKAARLGAMTEGANQMIEPRLTGHANVIGVSTCAQLLLPELRIALPASLDFSVG